MSYTKAYTIEVMGGNLIIKEYGGYKTFLKAFHHALKILKTMGDTVVIYNDRGRRVITITG